MHTPRPWNVTEAGEQVQAGPILIVQRPGGTATERRANARLIAESPRLLAAAEQYLRITHSYRVAQEGECPPDCECSYCRIYKALGLVVLAARSDWDSDIATADGPEAAAQGVAV